MKLHLHLQHLGSLWRNGVKSVKQILNFITGDQVLTFEELSTVFTNNEVKLNSRLICIVSSDPNDYSAATPCHILNLMLGTVLPEPDVTINHLYRYQLLTAIYHSFWRR